MRLKIEGNKELRRSPRTEFKKGHIPTTKGRNNKINKICPICKKEFKIYQGKSRVESNRGKYCSHKCHWMRLRELNGEKSHSWIDGRTPEIMLIRRGSEYKLWRKVVFERDNFTCQKYGIRGGRLIAHHINNFADFPELRLAIDNGITLSYKAHREFHKKYGSRNNTREQLVEFLI